MVKLPSLGGMEVGRETQDFFLLFFPPVPTPNPPPPHPILPNELAHSLLVVQLHSKISNLNKITLNVA